MVIEARNLTKQYNGKGGFIDVTLSVREGEVFSFLGKNGAGKSTFIRTMVGLLNPTYGSATLLGKPLGDIEARRYIGYLPELFQYHTWLTGYELLYQHGLFYKMSKKEIEQRIPIVIQKIGLVGHENKKVKQYSKGMKQRIGLGCAIIANPKLLFLDEPTSALDPIGRKEVRDIILGLKKEGTSIFLNTHLLSEVEMVTDRVAILDKGKILKVGEMKDILHAPIEVIAKDINEEIIALLRNFDPNLNITKDGLELNILNKDLLPEIASCIVKNKGLLYEMKTKENPLEQVFIDMVGEEDLR